MSVEGFKCGELILTSKPFVYVLNNTERGKRCDFCFVRNTTLKRCSNCLFVYFCNRECQSKAWEEHKEECKGLKKSHPKEPTPSLRLLTQMILKIKRVGVEEPCEVVGGNKIAFKNLESHAAEVKKDLRCCQQMVAFIATLKEFIGERNVPPPSEFTEIFGKMVINTFSIWDAEMQSIGSGLYLGASIFDHSCEPDAEILFDGPILNTRMVRDVPHRDYRRVYISYIDQMQLTEDRQKHLCEQYYFTCVCVRCTDPYYDELMKKLYFNDTSAKNVEAKSAKELERIKQMKRDKASPFQLLRACQNELEAQEEVLADTHITRVRLLEIAFDACVQANHWRQAIDYGIQLIRPYKLYYGHYHPNVCIQLFKIGKIHHLIGKSRTDLNEAEKHLLQAKEALCVSHGQNHPLYQDLLLLLHMCQQELAAR